MAMNKILVCGCVELSCSDCLYPAASDVRLSTFVYRKQMSGPLVYSHSINFVLFFGHRNGGLLGISSLSLQHQ